MKTSLVILSNLGMVFTGLMFVKAGMNPITAFGSVLFLSVITVLSLVVFRHELMPLMDECADLMGFE